VRNVARNNHWASEHHACLYWVLRQSGANGVHGLREVNVDYFFTEIFMSHFWQELCRVSFERFKKDSIARDLSNCLTVSAAGHRE
jgi:hypothetical protein